MKRNRSWIVLAVVVLGLGAGLIGWLRVNSADPAPDRPDLLKPGTPPGPDGDTGEKAELALLFDDGSLPDSEKTMRFGLMVMSAKDELTPSGYKQLTWHPQGLTSNASVKTAG